MCKGIEVRNCLPSPFTETRTWMCRIFGCLELTFRYLNFL